MPIDQKPDNEKPNSNDTPPSRLPDCHSTPGRNKNPQPAHGTNNTPEGERPPSHKTLRREIRWLDAINALVAVAMLGVSIAAYRVASDTSDIKGAVRNISSLASQTKRQADNSDAAVKALTTQFGEMQKQTAAFQTSAGAAQGQLLEMRSEQRAIVTVGGINFAENKDPIGTYWRVSISLQNSGSSPTKNLAIYQKVGQIWITPMIQIGPPNPNNLPRMPPDPAELINSENIKPDRIPLGPHVVMPVASVTMRDAELRDTVGPGGGAVPYICGIATYDDNLPGRRHHITKFCYVFRIANMSNYQYQDGKVTVGAVTPTFQMSPYWNCTDDECKGDKRRYRAAMATIHQSATPGLH